MSRWAGVAAAAAVVMAFVPGTANAAVTWTAQAPPLPSGWGSGNMTAVSCPSATNCEALATSQGAPASAEGWNGTSWTDQSSFPSYDLNSVRAISCGSATACIATGADLQNGEQADGAVWNGTTWSSSPVIGGADSILNGVSCPAAKACFAVGQTTADGSNSPLAEKWNGTKWTAESVPMPSGTFASLQWVSCVSATDCIAVGDEQTSGVPGVTSYAWNGTTWTQQAIAAPAGNTDPGLVAVSCTSATDCTAIGDNVSGGSGNNSFAESWNGSAWTVQDVPVPASAITSGLSAVSCSRATCTAVGFYYTGAGKEKYALADYFNGTSWKVQTTATPVSDKFLTGISCTASRACMAVGGSVVHGFEDYRPLAEQEQAS